MIRRLPALILVSLAACSECRYSACPTAFDGIRFNYVNKSGKDLLYGTSKKYESTDLAMFAISDEGKRVYSETTVSLMTGEPSVVSVVLASDRETYFEVGKVVTDTLKFEFRPHPSECCGTYSELTKVYLNNHLMCIDNSQFQIKERN